jgi:Holliday junction resolvasome RuvABC endonuclease subunit
MTKSKILGLDLSLRAAGCVLMEPGAPWSEIKTLVCGASLKRDASECERLNRLLDSRRSICSFLDQHGGADVAVVEQYAFSKLSSQAHALGELGGVIKTALYERGIKVVTLEASRARSCLGKFPRKDTKKHVQAVVRSMGCPVGWTADVVDAWVIANGYCVENGLGGYVIGKAA